MQFKALEAKDFQIRHYQPSDRDPVRTLCCETGFLGNAIDPIFEDRELFADFLTDYYLKHEPESAFVVIKNNVLKGYLLGSRRALKHQFHSFLQYFVYSGTVLGRYFRYNRESRRFIHWMILKAWREVPAAPRWVGHFHMNILPEARSILVFRKLLETYLRYLYDCGVKQVHAQVVTFEGRRGFKLFDRYGFKVLNQSEITKYRQFTNQPVYLCTIIKEFEEKSDLLLYPVGR